jgi:hypothetical protein
LIVEILVYVVCFNALIGWYTGMPASEMFPRDLSLDKAIIAGNHSLTYSYGKLDIDTTNLTLVECADAADFANRIADGDVWVNIETSQGIWRYHWLRESYWQRNGSEFIAFTRESYLKSPGLAYTIVEPSMDSVVIKKDGEIMIFPGLIMALGLWFVALALYEPLASIWAFLIYLGRRLKEAAKKREHQ